MAKVKIQGNASGTGILTVTAPNTSTDRTITLPDATGTLLNSDGSGANLTNLPNGSQLDHSGNKKIEAISTGVDVTGVAVTDGITSSGNITFDNGNSTVSIRSDGAIGSYIQYGTDEHLRFLYDSGAGETMRLHDSGYITMPQGVTLGNGNTYAASNTLDDYEEGTWTASIQGANQSGMNTTGYYTKIGRQVFFQWYSAAITISSASGSARVTGLPFTSATNAYGLFYYLHGNGVDGASTGGYVQDNNTYFRFVDTNSISDASYVDGSGKFIMVSGSYFVS